MSDHLLDRGIGHFKGKVALVTGGSRGIGKAIALELARLGTNIIFNYFRSHNDALQTQSEIEAFGVSCIRVKAHLGEYSKVMEMFELIREHHQSLDILVNNAASGVNRPATELEEKHWDWVFAINAKAPWLCAIEAAKMMDDGGNIINITSLGSQKVLPDYFSVGTSKAALEAMTRYLAVELAPKNISVNAVSGGFVDTKALDSFPGGDKMALSGENTLLGEMVTAEDISKVVSFLCGPDARMIRGQVIVVDGGISLSP